MKFKREIKFEPGYDKRSSDPNKNYGIGSAILGFYLTGPSGTIQFKVVTSWYLSNVQRELDSKLPEDPFPYLLHKPMPSDLGYHSPKPMYEGQKPISNRCPWIDGDCYYDGSTLNADRIFDILTAEGSDGVWKALEKYYKDVFVKVLQV